LYKDDLPSPQLFFAEFEHWKMKVQARIITADLCAASLKACDPDDFPNLYILLKIAATLPVTSCECERSISKMRRLNNYMRLALLTGHMHIKYDKPISLDKVVYLFEGLRAWMMQLQSLPYETE
ncbi:unnamed protein product, partial [Porites lobata]